MELTTGRTTLIKDGIGPGGIINGIGYNRFDNFIYGMVADVTGSGSTVIQIASDGTWQLLSTRIEGNRNIIMGDIDNQGRFWISDTGRPWWQIDLRPGSTTFGKVVQQGTSTHADSIADWSYVPGGGDFLYAVQYTSTSSTLVRWSRTSKTWETIRAYGNLSGSNVWGALYAASDGNMYGSENTGGAIYKFPVAPTVGVPSKLASGPTTSQNDGARCIDSEDITS